MPSTLSVPMRFKATSKNWGSTMKLTPTSSSPARSTAWEACWFKKSSSPVRSVRGGRPSIWWMVWPEHMYIIST